MKKGIIFIILLVFVVFILQVQEVQSEETFQAIPDDAIRLRILANSDAEEDQQIKRIVRDDVNAYISELVQYIDDIEEGRRVIDASVPEIEKIVAQTLQREGVDQAFTVEYRSNVTFPTKIYDDYLYPAGEYEAVLISLGEGKGANWWCVLFPPLCFLDFSNGTTVETEGETDEKTEEETEELKEEHEGSIVIETEETEESIEDEEEEVEVKFFLFEWLGLS
ncbi:stage II sporulation protein R [Pseudogracilibacillus auburnensis]|uniref:Stage II sporulation protein R n=1 Tax=Pseudogracilibacillus auburnensis TaxID=1494959 RepID=A0A2V3W2N6_9BACI|nr:stage II sporulation protein R [Pseudogracilibacillus auburnensis]MBO1002064.1 stage II sporulation protein R [Pseudogracilibacillus auburnensis]PXW87388.1 stage II sporulation protein R [Pseudogracilibacillus auburnensis]